MAKRDETKSTEVVVPKGDTSVANVPSFMKEHVGKGTENVRQEDVAIPLLKLTQALSPQVIEFDQKPGTFWHNILEQDFGKQVRVVCVYTDTRAILWRPREAGGGILARSNDLIRWTPPNAEFQVPIYKGTKTVTWRTRGSVAESRLLEWGTFDPDDPKSAPAATKMHNLVVCFPDYPDMAPAVITMQRASIKVARKLLGKYKLTQAPSFGIYVNLSSVVDTNPAGDTFYNYKFELDGLVQNEDEFNRYKDWYTLFSKVGVEIRDEDLQAESEVVASTQTADTSGVSDDGKVKY